MKLTHTHHSLLRAALGLTAHNSTPTRDTLPHDSVTGYAQEVADLISIGYLVERQIAGEGGAMPFIYITDAGRAALAAHQEVLPDSPNLESDPAPASAKPPRKPRAAKAAPTTGDLLDDAPEAGAVVAFQAPRERAVIVLKSEETKKKLQALVLQSADIVEVKNDDGREQVHRMAMDLKKARTGITHTGKAAREDAQAFCAAVLEEERSLIAITSEEEKRLFTLRDTYDEEQARIEAERAQAEAARIAVIRAKIDAINVLPGQLAGATAAELLEAVKRLVAMEPTEEEFAELLGEAAVAIDTVGSAISALYHAAARREAEEAERVRVQAEEKQRLADESKRLADEAQQLADERAKVDAQRQAQEAQQQAMQVQAQQQAAAMDAIKNAQEYAAIESHAYGLEGIRAIALTIEVDPAKHGMAAPMVQMAKDMAVRTLEGRIAALVALELPAAWDEAIEHERVMQSLLDVPEAASAPMAQQALLADDVLDLVMPSSMDWDEPAPLAAEAAPEPAPAPAPAPVAAPAPAALPVNTVNYVRPNLEHLPMDQQRDDANAESHFCANLRTLLRHRGAENVGALFHQQLVMAIVEQRGVAA